MTLLLFLIFVLIIVLPSSSLVVVVDDRCIFFLRLRIIVAMSQTRCIDRDFSRGKIADPVQEIFKIVIRDKAQDFETRVTKKGKSLPSSDDQI
jgi:hypothetical protein